MSSDFIKLEQVKIPKCFSEHAPSKEKIKKKKEILKKYYSSTCITINQNDFLVDGYATFLAAVELGYEQLPYKVDTSKDALKGINTVPKRLYFYGKHSLEDDTKEYVWVVRTEDEKNFRDVKVGDKLLVCTKFGTNPMYVTKIRRSREKPVDGKIRCVVRKATY